MTAVDGEPALIDSVLARLREHVDAPDGPQCESFVRQYYRWVPTEDLLGRDASDLYGAAMAHWRLAGERRRGATAIRVYDPELERDGWESPHTVIEIVSDDMPFLVDSLTMELNREALGIHLTIHPVLLVRRDDAGKLLEVLPAGVDSADATRESVLHVEVDRRGGADERHALEASIARVLAEVRAAVEDWTPMRERLHAVIDTLAVSTPDAVEHAESEEYLRWLETNHFTFLGYQDYEIRDAALRPVAGTALGVLRVDAAAATSDCDDGWARAIADLPRLLVLTKASARSTVHRPSYLDYVGVKRVDAEGRLIGEHRFLGLYTTVAYWERAQQIPILREKVEHVLELAGFAPDSHDRKALLEILEEYPRDELVQIDPDELFEVAMGILAIGERQRIRLFVRRDRFERFVSCLVFLPRDRFNTANRQRIGTVLGDTLGATVDEWGIVLSESVLVRIHYLFRTKPHGVARDTVHEIERRLVSVTRSWAEDLRDALVAATGEERGLALYDRYGDAFPVGYRDDWPARSAVEDIQRIEAVAAAGRGIAVAPYRPLDAHRGVLRCKLFSTDSELSLSDVLPMFENMGLRITDERPHELTRDGSTLGWIYDFGFTTERAPDFGAEGVSERFQEAFVGVWHGDYESDPLNRLVLDAALTGREVAMLRAIGRYLWQAAPALGESALHRSLTAHPGIAALLVSLFRTRFHPATADSEEAEHLAAEIEQAIDAVGSLEEDRVLRGHLAVLRAMTRTDYFQRTALGEPKSSLAFKLDPRHVPLVPEPRPHHEIFVHSPRLEGVHLRGGRIARGGLRWSDRRDDFRTEILGLMKAQTVKNAVIVPVGAKGGFVVRRPPVGDAAALRNEALACYRTLVASLLELTDNVVAGTIVPPADTVRYDGDDSYLVVAADKGTAALSDVANEISLAHGYWLGDAFASGGSSGYDHKRIGITARGAWEAVRCHFRELGIDIQRSAIAVIGIGDMSGDVFGNGMLLSRHLRLIGAFNHEHVFLDPDPDPEASFAERARLAALAQSGWGDYDPAAISVGGGVWARAAKSISLSPQVRAVLGVDDEALPPDAVIRTLLRAPVDLLWNGGIGTYVKASTESHADVGDKANDGVRVNGSELRCRVVGEGGNLGFTQRGRIEYAIAGGRINTDAIDNVGGVNCSDREVNIKILLDGVVGSGGLTVEQRDALLAGMTDEVSAQVLEDSYSQTQALSIAVSHAAELVEVHARLIRNLETTAGLDRALEFLPTEEEIGERRVHDRGLSSPELAVLLSYAKIALHAALQASELPDDPYLDEELISYFPPMLAPRFPEEIRRHPLRREIIATHLSNDFVDHAGMSAAFSLGEETGATPADLARGYTVAREVFEMRSFWQAVKALDDVAEAATQTAMLQEGRKLIERSTRWLVRNLPSPLKLAASIERFTPGVGALAAALPGVLDDPDREAFEGLVERLEQGGAHPALAARAAGMGVAFAAFDVVEIAEATSRPLAVVIDAYFRAGSRFSLSWLRDRILELPRASRWQALSRASLRDDVSTLQRSLTIHVLLLAPPGAGVEEGIDAWSATNAAAVERYLGMLADIKASRSYDLATLPVALREARNLLRGI